MRYGICNETYEGWSHPRVCQVSARLGYTGLEIAPFTLAPLITDVSAEQRKQLRGQAEECGLTIFGLHWLLAKTTGFHLTSPTESVRQKTADYLIELARCCRDLGGDLMVHGSPAQRRIPEGATMQQAMRYAADTFKRAASAFADFGVRLCLEPLAAPDADFINTCAEGCELLDLIDHPNFVLHQDVRAMSAEKEPVPDLIRRFAARTGHFHANDPNLRGPGFGKVDFVPIFQALKETNYQGWVSVEVFDYQPDGETIARESIRYMKECEAKA
ncbi:MAG: sugar phosphate isomerase/epimerase [Planctomycetia bacterium]|nr:sugar phosphate isomerase/epimerase [Planctomycetia bacterium]